jgi:hypothetical protein
VLNIATECSYKADSDWSYRLYDRGYQDLSARRVKNFLHNIQAGSGALSASYPMGTGALSLGVKRCGREINLSPPTSAMVKNTQICASTTQYVFMYSA